MKALIFFLLSFSALASESTTVLIEESSNGEPSQVFIAEPNDEDIFKFAVELTSPLPFTYVGGKVSVSLFKDIIQVGLDAGLFVLPGKYEGTAGGGQVGAHVQIVPVPYKWGKRIYLAGKVYRSFEFWGLPLVNRTGLMAGIGYRQPLDIFGKKRYVFTEAGVAKDIMHSYDNSTIYTLHGLTVGFQF
jgi:hypothetical protein